MSHIVGTYGVKFFKEITNEQGVPVRLEIHQRGWEDRPIEIGCLQALTLSIQGSQDDIATPLVKTSCKIVLVDNAFEEGLDEDGEKFVDGFWRRYTNWTEFYTPDSTLYLVKIFHNERLVWSGYITPDSYQESLDAFGTITLTARDNLGHLQDFEFDMTPDVNGLVNVKDLMDAAFDKIAFPMDTIYGDVLDGNELLANNGTLRTRDLCINASTLSGDDWYEVLEEVLNSLGWVMRFADNNSFQICPLRFLPDYLWSQEEREVPVNSMKFLGRGAGTRTFDPAYREIEETIDYGQEDDIAPDILVAKEGSHTISQGRFLSFLDQDVVKEDNTTIHATEYRWDYGNYASAASDTDNGDWVQLPHVFICPDGNYPISEETAIGEGESMREYLFIVSNLVNGNQSSTFVDINSTFIRRVKSTALTLTLKFAQHPASHTNLGRLYVNEGARLKEIEYTVRYTKDNAVRYWNGTSWQENSINLTKEYEPVTRVDDTLEIQMTESDIGQHGELSLIIHHIAYQSTGYWWDDIHPDTPQFQVMQGVFARLESVTFGSRQSTKMKSDKVTTVVNASYNVRHKRKPLFGCLSQTCGFVFPSNYENAFFYYDDDGYPQLAPYMWEWNTDRVTLPFPVKIHQQILMYHFSTSQVLEGNCLPCDFVWENQDGELRYDAPFIYKGMTYLLMSVTHDLLTDRFSSAIFRNWMDYEWLWSGEEQGV